MACGPVSKDIASRCLRGDEKVMYLPYEATGVLSSVGSIKEMLEGIKK